MYYPFEPFRVKFLYGNIAVLIVHDLFLSVAKVALVRCWRRVSPVTPPQDVKPRPTYLPMAQIRPDATSSRVGSGRTHGEYALAVRVVVRLEPCAVVIVRVG